MNETNRLQLAPSRQDLLESISQYVQIVLADPPQQPKLAGTRSMESLLTPVLSHRWFYPSEDAIDQLQRLEDALPRIAGDQLWLGLAWQCVNNLVRLYHEDVTEAIISRGEESGLRFEYCDHYTIVGWDWNNLYTHPAIFRREHQRDVVHRTQKIIDLIVAELSPEPSPEFKWHALYFDAMTRLKPANEQLCIPVLRVGAIRKFPARIAVLEK